MQKINKNHLRIQWKFSIVIISNINLKVEYKIAADPVEASNIIDGSYDGAIIDLKLDDDEEGGNKIVKELYDTFTRIPIIFVTAYADLVIDHPSVIKIRRREDGTYNSDLLLFQKIQDTLDLHDIIGRQRIRLNNSCIGKFSSKIFYCR